MTALCQRRCAGATLKATYLPLFNLEAHGFQLLLQLALALLRRLDVPLQLRLQLAAGGLELLQLDFELLILLLVVGEILFERAARGGARWGAVLGRCHDGGGVRRLALRRGTVVLAAAAARCWEGVS